MNNTNPDISGVSARLAEHTAHLAKLTEQIGDLVSAQVLAQLEPRLRQGLVRVAVVGVTGSGKSTMLNALVGRLVLPENPSVSSPIPVWLGYQQGPDALAEIYRTQDGKTVTDHCDSLTFRRRYCYNLRDIHDKDRSRYNEISFSTIRLNAPVLRENVTLIDTLGISATTVDSRKTIRVLEEGVDAVVFVTRNSKLNLEEMRFLYRHVLGLDRQEDPSPLAPNPRPILPENLLFVYNNFFGVPNRTEFAQRIRTFYQDSGLGLSAERIEALVQSNCFYINAYQARMGKLGPYPYAEAAPEGSSPEEQAMLEKREQIERREWEKCDREQCWADSNLEGLGNAIQNLGHRLGTGRGSVSSKRIAELLAIIDGVIYTADRQSALHHDNIKDLRGLQDYLSRMQQDDLVEQNKLESAMNALCRNYTQSFRNLLCSLLPEMKAECVKKAQMRSMPSKFKQDYPAYVEKGKKEQEDYINDLLPEFCSFIHRLCCEQLKTALKERRKDDFRTPLQIMEETRKLIRSQALLFNARVEKLRKDGAENMGLYLPQPMAVEQLFGSLEQDLVERIQQVIADACICGGKNFEEKIEPYVRKCRLNLFQNLWAMLKKDQGPLMLWKKICKNLFDPMAGYLVENMPEHTGTVIYDNTAEAFRLTTNAICEAHRRLFVSLEMGIDKLDRDISNAGAAADRNTEEAEKLKHTCEEIKQDILQIQYNLQHG